MRVGIIGLGDIGYTQGAQLAAKGVHVLAADLPEKYESLKLMVADTGIELVRNTRYVAGNCDYLLLCVPVDNIDEAMGQIGDAVRPRTVVGGQLSVKTPEIEAIERYVPEGCPVVTVHSLYNAALVNDPTGHRTVAMHHRGPRSAYDDVIAIMSLIGCDFAEIEGNDMPAYKVHDKGTSDTQCITHLCNEGMGTAWMDAKVFPWENTTYMSPIDNVKILNCLRQFYGKAHVFGGLAQQNPFAPKQIIQYDESTSALFLKYTYPGMGPLESRVMRAREKIFGDIQNPVLLDPAIMEQYSLGDPAQWTPNSHLSVLAMVDAWAELGINPYDHRILETPPFKLRLGIAEYLFSDWNRLQSAIQAPFSDAHPFGRSELREHDLRFVKAVHAWRMAIESGSPETYAMLFNRVKEFFGEERLKEGLEMSKELIAAIAASTRPRML